MTDSVRLKWLLTESDVRAGTEAAALPLLSVSISWGVRRREASDMTTRAASDDLSNYKLCRTGDLVINRMRAFQGALGIAPEAGVVSPDYAVLRVDPRIDKRWLNYFLTSGFTVATMASLVRGIGGTEAGNVRTPRLNVSDLQSMTVPLVSADEQRAIADYLDRETARIDTLIEEQQRLIEMLRERRRAVVEEAVAIVDTTGARLKHVIRSVRQGWSPQCCSWPADGVETWAVLKAGAANGGRFRPMENKELPEDEIPRPEIVVIRGDLLVSRANTRELVGSAAVVEGDFPRLMLCDKLYAFSLDESRVDSRFVAAVLGSRRWRDLIELEATGTSHSMLNISQSDIVNLPMQLPSVDEQRRIVTHLQSETAKIDQLIAETEQLIDLARERRSALITAAVTGQIDVREMA
ncbi:hypothetical protein ACFYT3_30695 [Nocardia amikacinitolerans]|uniref:restriction endonuclease subunit S n=1 Tax=Nocardia amikacinitolerans TaxID=756689 RepID=UPI0036CF900B